MNMKKMVLKKEKERKKGKKIEKIQKEIIVKNQLENMKKITRKRKKKMKMK